MSFYHMHLLLFRIVFVLNFHLEFKIHMQCLWLSFIYFLQFLIINSSQKPLEVTIVTRGRESLYEESSPQHAQANNQMA